MRTVTIGSETTILNRIRIYIAGPMRGYDDDNFPAFYEAEKQLELKKVYEILNPARMDDEEHSYDHDVYNIDYKAAMKRDIDAIFNSHAIYMLRGWEKSDGARAEHALAVYLGLSIQYQ